MKYITRIIRVKTLARRFLTGRQVREERGQTNTSRSSGRFNPLVNGLDVLGSGEFSWADVGHQPVHEDAQATVFAVAQPSARTEGNVVDGAVLGSKAFVNGVFATNRERFGVKRKDGARRLRYLEDASLFTLRDLRINPVG